ncbi:MAG TPA: 30S ribosomal protein S2 [Candidatus Paceibacterota bacterium]|jgi:small subunit ribosomal protein S2|nr:30S ribosomal protein S2 [Candidatus Paceibacterota bacterium]
MSEATTTNPKVEELFKAGAHFGFVRSRRHPSAKPFIYGTKNRIEIFDLEKTAEELDKAASYIKEIAKGNGTVLFVGGKSEAREAIKSAAESLDMPYVAGRWIGGTLTNFSEIKKRVAKLEDLTNQKQKGELAKYTKKERLLIDREIENLHRFFSGLANLKDKPAVMFVIDAKHEHIAVAEAKTMGVPVVALCGSDCNFGEVDYAIPGNDSSVPSVKYFVERIAAAYKEGKSEKAGA